MSNYDYASVTLRYADITLCCNSKIRSGLCKISEDFRGATIEVLDVGIISSIVLYENVQELFKIITVKKIKYFDGTLNHAYMFMDASGISFIKMLTLSKHQDKHEYFDYSKFGTIRCNPENRPVNAIRSKTEIWIEFTDQFQFIQDDDFTYIINLEEIDHITPVLISTPNVMFVDLDINHIIESFPNLTHIKFWEFNGYEEIKKCHVHLNITTIDLGYFSHPIDDELKKLLELLPNVKTINSTKSKIAILPIEGVTINQR
jgi:hypothetical protein